MSGASQNRPTEEHPPRPRLSLGAKVLLSLVSLAVGLLLLEVGLRITGYTLAASRQDPYEANYADEELPFAGLRYSLHGDQSRRRVVVAVGDSYTFGGNVAAQETYPQRLAELLAADGYGQGVVNLGRCEDNTWSTVRRLRAFLDTAEHKGLAPELVILLVGSADRFAYRGLGRPAGLTGWLSSLRIYKMARAIQLALVQRDLINDRGYTLIPAAARPQDDYSQESGLGAAAARPLQDLNAVYQVLAASSRLRAEGKPEQARQRVKQAHQLAISLGAPTGPLGCVGDHKAACGEDGQFEPLLELLVVALVSGYAEKLAHDQAVALLMDVGAHFPNYLWDANDTERHWTHPRDRLIQLVQLQSRYDAAELLSMMDKILKARPKLAGNSRYAAFRAQLKDLAAPEAEVERLRESLWAEMIKACRQHNVPVMVVNYPVDYRTVNQALGRIARDNGLPLVDVNSVFNSLIKREGRRPYLLDDDHCTPAGFKVIAQQVHLSIKAKGLLKK